MYMVPNVGHSQLVFKKNVYLELNHTDSTNGNLMYFLIFGYEIATRFTQAFQNNNMVKYKPKSVPWKRLKK